DRYDVADGLVQRRRRALLGCEHQVGALDADAGFAGAQESVVDVDALDLGGAEWRAGPGLEGRTAGMDRPEQTSAELAHLELGAELLADELGHFRAEEAPEQGPAQKVDRGQSGDQDAAAPEEDAGALSKFHSDGPSHSSGRGHGRQGLLGIDPLPKGPFRKKGQGIYFGGALRQL